MSHDVQARGFLRFLYTQNPFYLISACLTLYGLHMAFRAAGGGEPNPWPLAAALGGYTLLLALTAWLIVRFGQVWDDARSIMIILLLLFLALSLSFDEVCNTYPQSAKAVLACGLGFSIAVSESLLRGLGIRLPAGYRGPFYLLLGLFFVYPLWVSPEVTGLARDTILWRVFLFPVASGAAFLTLVPAIRRGLAMGDNGTPWRWPWFPGTIFAILAMGVTIRSYVLCLSFDPQLGFDSAFGLYYLLPFIGSIGIVLLEVARVGKYPGLSHFTLLAAPATLLAALHNPGGPVFEEFLLQVTERVGSPLWFGLVGLALFYAYAWRCGFAAGELGLSAALASLCIVAPDTRDVGDLALGSWWPLALAALLQWLTTLRTRASHRCLGACLLTVATASIALRETAFIAWRGVIPWHLALGSLIAVGLLFRDPFAAAARKLGAACLLLLGVAVVASLRRSWIDLPVLAAYSFALASVAIVCGWRWADPWFRVASLIDAAAGCVAILVSASHSLHDRVTPLAVYCLECGMVCFGVALSISLAKSGLLKRLGHYAAVWLAYVPPDNRSPS